MTPDTPPNLDERRMAARKQLLKVLGESVDDVARALVIVCREPNPSAKVPAATPLTRPPRWAKLSMLAMENPRNRFRATVKTIDRTMLVAIGMKMVTLPVRIEKSPGR